GRQRGAADGDHVGRVGRVPGRGGRVAGGGQERDAGVAGGGGERGVQGRVGRVLAAAEAHADRDDAGDRAGVPGGGGDQVGVGVAGGLDEQDVRGRGHGVGPLDVEGGLDGPAVAPPGRVDAGQRRAAGLVHLGERRRVGQAEGDV